MKSDKVNLKFQLKRFLVVCLASLIMALNLKSFVYSGQLYPGGANGLTVLFQRIFGDYLGIKVPFTVLNILFNSIPIYIGFKFIGKKFTLYSCFMIFLSAILTDMIPVIDITKDILLISVFGGMINGFVISICLMVDATTGGTDFIGIYLSDRKGVDSFNLVLIFNAMILLAGGALFGWDKALYSIIYQYASTQVVHILYKTYQHETFIIITDKPYEITEEIHKVCHHGATVINGRGAYGKTDKTLIYSVVSRSDISEVIRCVHEMDPSAFINAIKSERIFGRFYYKPRD